MVFVFWLWNWQQLLYPSTNGLGFVFIFGFVIENNDITALGLALIGLCFFSNFWNCQYFLCTFTDLDFASWLARVRNSSTIFWQWGFLSITLAWGL